jgi:hypothetical protein
MGVYARKTLSTLNNITPHAEEELEYILKIANRPDRKPWWVEILEEKSD